MRYYYERSDINIQLFGRSYICEHPVYNTCTLFEKGNMGLAVIQQRFDPTTKSTWWSQLDPWLANDLYLHPSFWIFFNKRAGPSIEGLYPTVTARQIMWGLKMKPMKKERWETVFDRPLI